MNIKFKNSVRWWWSVLALGVVLFAGGFKAHAFIHPGIPLTVADLDNVKSNLVNSPWSDGYAALLADGKSSTNYVMAGPFGYVNRNYYGNYDNLGAWENDMQAIFNLSRMWYFTGDANYAKKSHDILLAWANTMTNWNGNEAALDLGDYAYRYGVGADILRGTWPGWTAADTVAVSNLFANVYLPATYLNTNISTLGPANKGALSLAGSLVVAVFNDDTNLFKHILYLYRSTASCGVHNNSLTSGEMGETGRDQGHSYNYLLQMAFCAEVFYKQGIDVYSEDDNRLLADGEYYARNNLPPTATFIPFGTIDAYYLANSSDGGGYISEPMQANILRSAYVTRKGLTAPWMLRKRYATPAADGVLGSQTENENSFCFLKSLDTSTAAPPPPIIYPTATSVTSGFTDVDIGGSSPSGSSSYSNGIWTVTGGGTDIFTHNPDSCHFVYKALTGDCTVIAKVNVVQPTASNSRAGVMIRDTLSSSTAYRAFMTVTPSQTGDSFLHGWSVNWGGRENAVRPISQSSYWVKLERFGKMINLYVSLDGTSWGAAVVGQYDNLPSTMYVGLVVCSEVAGASCTATFSNVSITGGNGGNVTVPAAPYYVYASPDAGQVPLRWLTSFGANSYSVFRSLTNGGPYTLRASGLTNASYIDTNVAPNTTYYYVVTATNSAGVSGYSTQESVTTQPAPAPPAGLTALPGNGQATLLWAVSSGATSYNVKRSTTSGSGYVTITNVTGTSWVNTGLVNGTTYYYVISAIGAAGEGTNSSQVSVTPSASGAALFWSGAVNGNWDTTTANWVNNGSSANFQNGNAAVFDDSAMSNTTVGLSATLSPSVVIFNNASKSYSINGSAIGGTCGITLFGSGSVALNGAQTFTGGVSVQQGATLMAASSGVGSGTVTLNGGALKTVFGSGLNSTVTNTISVGSGGATFALSTSAGNLTLTGPISGSGNVTIAPPGGILNSIYLNFSTNSVSGTITIPNSYANNQTVTRIGAATAGSRYAAWSIGGAQDRFTTLDFGTGTIEFGSLSGSGTIYGNSSGVHTMSVGALNQDSTFDGNIIDGTGTVALTKVGSGTLTLTGANTYTGTNNVNAGKLLILTGSQAKGNYTVANGATLSVTNVTTSSALISNLTLAAGSTLEFMDITSATTPLLAASNMVVSGSCTVKISLPGGIALGTYPLASYSGSFSGNFSNMQLQLPAGITGTLVSNANQIAVSITVIPIPAAPTDLVATSQGTQIELDWSAVDFATGYRIWRSLTSGSGYTLVGSTTNTTFTDSGLAINQTYYYVLTATNSFGSSTNSSEANATTQPAMKWTGAASVNWDKATTNWVVNGSPAAFQDGASVWFDDTALSNVAINVSATMSPSTMVVSNSSKSYSFSGNDISGTGGLLKLGNGTVTFNVANTYSGGTTLSNGMIVFANGDALGTGTVTANGGTLKWSYISGNSTFANSLVVNGPTTLDVAGGGNWYLNGNISGNGAITRGTAATLSLYPGGDNSGYTGTFTVPNHGNAVVRFNSATAGSANASWVFNNTTVGRTTLSWSGTGTISFGSMTGSGVFNTDVTGNKTISVGALGLNDTFSGVIANGTTGTPSPVVGLTKVGTGTMMLLGANTYTGTNNITAGKLVISTASLANGVYLVASNATFAVTNTSTTSATISNLIVAAGSALEFQRVTNTVTPLIAASNLIVNGSCIVKIVVTNGLMIGTNYPLISYSGTISGQFANLLLQMPGGYGGVLVSNANLITVSVTNPPVAPTGLTATSGNAQVMLNWNLFPGATSYNLKRSTVNGGPYTTITNVTTASYTDTNVANGTMYYYVVSAVNVSSESTNSVQVAVVPSPNLPSPTHRYSFNEASGTNVSDSIGGANGTLLGNAVFNGTGQVVLNGTSSTYVNLPSNLLSGLTNVTFDAWFTYTVGNNNVHLFAMDNGNGTGSSGTYLRYNLYDSGNGHGGTNYFETVISSSGNALSGGMVLPQSVTNHVTVIYDPVGGVKRIYINGILKGSYSGTLPALSSYPENRFTLGASPWNSDPYLVGTLDEFRIYSGALSTNAVAALQAAGPGQLMETAPGAPTGLTAMATNAAVALNWTTSSGAIGYNVKRSTINNGPYTTITNVTTTGFTDTGLLNGTNYYYVVSAMGYVSESVNSTQVSARPVSTVPPQLAMSVNSSQLQLNWPADHLGWRLQSQTNSLAFGLGTNWATVPNSTNQNQFVAPINSTNGSVFYRLVYP
jgi:autotransporter-associated beta strand protein